jgi:hypothetical protein
LIVTFTPSRKQPDLSLNGWASNHWLDFAGANVRNLDRFEDEEDELMNDPLSLFRGIRTILCHSSSQIMLLFCLLVAALTCEGFTRVPTYAYSKHSRLQPSFASKSYEQAPTPEYSGLLSAQVRGLFNALAVCMS